MVDPQRLTALMEERGLSQAELARRSGVAQPTIFKLTKGLSQSSAHLHKIARELGTTAEYLTGESDDIGHGSVSSGRAAYNAPPRVAPSDQSASVSIPEIDIAFSMGGGMVISDHADQRRVDVPREWLKPLIKGSYADVFAARGEGDSMEPTLRDGDIVIVDTAQNAVNSQDRVWCIGHGDLGMIKRLRARPDGGIEIMSDNSAVSSFIAYDGEVQIIGRVVFIGRRM
jgi:phage repressor protein C with HTH and peptisase S24 domain